MVSLLGTNYEMDAKARAGRWTCLAASCTRRHASRATRRIRCRDVALARSRMPRRRQNATGGAVYGRYVPPQQATKRRAKPAAIPLCVRTNAYFVAPRRLRARPLLMPDGRCCTCAVYAPSETKVTEDSMSVLEEQAVNLGSMVSVHR
jgi:hypothetical protein